MGPGSLSESRLSWNKAQRCTKCGVDRPHFFFNRAKTVCDPCQRQRMRRNFARWQARDRKAARAKALKAYYATPVPLRRCRSAYYQIRRHTPHNVPAWATIRSLLPIYEYAHELDSRDPDYRHIVVHIVPLTKQKDVCGLHTIKNLRILRKRRSTSGLSDSV